MKKQIFTIILLLMGGISGFGQFKLDATGTNDLRLRTNNLDRVNILNNGNVGIGTATPDTKLDINGDISFTTKGLITTSGLKNDFNRGNNSVISITSPNVGITGFNTPFEGTVLHLYCTSGLLIANENTGSTAVNRIITGAGEDIILRGASGATLIYDASAKRWRVISANSNGMPWTMNGNANTSTNSFIGTTDARSLRMATNDSIRVKIDSLGIVGIGTTSPDPLTRLHVKSKGNALVNYTIPEGSVAVFEGSNNSKTASLNIVGDFGANAWAAINFLSDAGNSYKSTIYADQQGIGINGAISAKSNQIRMYASTMFHANYELARNNIGNLGATNLSLDRGTAPVLLIYDLASNINISGIQNCKDGSIIIILNNDDNNNITLVHQSGSADLYEKINCPSNTNLVIPPTGTVTLMGVFVPNQTGLSLYQWRVISVLK